MEGMEKVTIEDVPICPSCEKISPVCGLCKTPFKNYDRVWCTIINKHYCPDCYYKIKKVKEKGK